MRRANKVEIGPAVYQALKGLEFDGLRLSFDDRLRKWTLKNEEGVPVVSSDTIEGLESNLNERRKKQRAQPFKKVRVIIFPQWGGDPYVGTVTSRPYQNKIIVSIESSDSSRKRNTVDLEKGYGGDPPLLTLFKEEIFEELMNLKAKRAAAKREEVAILSKLKAEVEPWLPDDKAQPISL